jgi:hypothetical protein
MTAQSSKPTKQKHISKTKQSVKHRAKIIAREMINGATAAEALITAGYSKTNATTTILNNPIVKQTFNDLLDKAGLSDDVLAERIRFMANDAKETKYFADKGIVTDQREVEALSIQADMLKFAAKVKGHVIDKQQTASVNVAYTLTGTLKDMVDLITGVDKPVDNQCIDISSTNKISVIE